MAINAQESEWLADRRIVFERVALLAGPKFDVIPNPPLAI